MKLKFKTVGTLSVINLNILLFTIDAFHASFPGGESFVQRNIKLPTEEQARRQARLFYEISGFPKGYPYGLIWATIDGTVSKKNS